MRCTGPFGRGTDRGIDAERPFVSDSASLEFKPLLGGRGTFRFIAICEFSFLPAPADDGLGALLLLLGVRLDGFALKLCGGRGTDRPAGAGVRPVPALVTALCAPSFPRAVELTEFMGFSPPRDTAARDAAGGVMWLTVDRANAPAAGLAAVSPGRAPSVA